MKIEFSGGEGGFFSKNSDKEGKFLKFSDKFVSLWGFYSSTSPCPCTPVFNQNDLNPFLAFLDVFKISISTKGLGVLH